MSAETSTANAAVKRSSLHIEDVEHPSKIQHGDTALALFATGDGLDSANAQELKRLERKIDWAILPCLSVCYAFYYIDKTTLSYAAIFGIKEDLELSGKQYSWLSSVFYFGFLVWAVPTNFLLQKFPVAKYLGVNIILWGLFLMLQAAAKNFTQLVVLRVISGAAEACSKSDPAFMLITSMFYTRRQQPIRIGLWYTANGLGIALGGLLGYGIGHIQGALSSWKYEFLIIGALCTAWGFIILVLLPDSPVTARNFSPRERWLAVQRLRDNQTGVENKTIKPTQVLEALLDWKVWVFLLLGLSGNIPNGGISNFGTLIISGFGFSTLVTTLMQIPYGVFIALMILLSVYINDRLPPNNRCIVTVCFLLPNVAGAFGLCFLPEHNRVGRLICYYLTGSYNASFVLILSILTANIAGHTKKVVTNAMIFLGVCAGNIAGPFFYKSEQAPRYVLGIWSMIVSNLIEIALVVFLRIMLAWENRRRDAVQQRENDTAWDRDQTAFSDLTDKQNSNFRYVY
ncbi:MFS general substrate transporter [Aspergillus homomorphus CBS 101889]|uniref:MFS general substrate transporter n=1 Tax=Aspergillus homomorphus (strain CBS 101889) TaxID=1450537 RepID=A0A395I6Y3_ASPHC|nr:MFS general substrate transporter [Aspergillus homomorphus CBS 101889]RAL15950.1 MFS general substrate transporter [Aspergillus homomorphus CBS 101889]